MLNDHVVVAAGQVVEAVGQIEREFAGRTAGAAAPLFPGALGVHDQFRRRRANAGNRGVGLRDHVGLDAETETARLVGGHRGVVRQDDRQFGERRLSRERPARERPEQPPDRRQPDPQRPLPVEQADFHGDTGSFHAARWPART